VRNVPTFIASGFFLGYKGNVYLLTAAHATHDLDGGAFVSLNGIRPLTSAAIRSTSASQDHFDIAYWKVDELFVKSIGATVIQSGHILRARFEQPIYAISGYPASKNKLSKAVRVGAKEIRATCFTFSAPPARIDFSDFGKSEQLHIGLRYGAGRNHEKELQTPPKPAGMSGGPLWVARDAYSAERWFLGGLFVEYHCKRGRVAFCTKIKPILDFIDETK